MKNRRLARLLTLLAAILVCLGLAAPAKATTTTFTCTLTEANNSTNTSPNPCTADARNVYSGEGNWGISYTVKGKVNFLQLQINNNPGPTDICWHYAKKSPVTTPMFSTPLIEEAATNACGSQYTDTNGPPLTFFAYIQGAGGGASVTITVTYPACTGSTDTTVNCPTENGLELNRMGLQQGTLAKLSDQGSALPQLTDPVVDVCKRRVLLG